jgi:hypothetical protein
MAGYFLTSPGQGLYIQNPRLKTAAFRPWGEITIVEAK